MRYRTLDVRLWGDVKFRSLSPLQPSGQALFLYLLTNPNTTAIPGLYRAGAAAMSEELRWQLDAFQLAFKEVENQGLVMADFQARVIFIPNAIRYNKPQSPNVVRSWASHWDEIPECELKNTAYQFLKVCVEDLGEGFAKAFIEAIGKACGKAMSNQEQEHKQEQEKDIIVSDADVTLIKLSQNCPQEAIQALYHEILPICRQVRVWNDARSRLLRGRWKENEKHQSLDFWRWYFEYVRESKFLTGQVAGHEGRPSFVVDLEWLIKPNNFAKVMEGKYHG